MNDRQTSGYYPDYGAFGHDSGAAGSYGTVGTTFADGDPLLGALPQQHTYGDDTGAVYPAAGYDTPGYQAPGYQTQGHGGPGYVTGTYSADTYATGSYDTGGYAPDGYAAGSYDTGTHPSPDQYGAGTNTPGTTTGTYDTAYGTGSYDAAGFWHPGDAAPRTQQYQAFPQQQDWDSGSYEAYGYSTGGPQTGIYEAAATDYTAGGVHATAWDTGAYDTTAFTSPEGQPVQAGPVDGGPPCATGAAPDAEYAGDGYAFQPDDPPAEAGPDAGTPDAWTSEAWAPDDEAEAEAESPQAAPTGAPATASRSRRRRPAKRSALLTIAVPSVAVMGVTAVAAAAVTETGQESGTRTQADAVSTNAPATQLDRQLARVSADANDFGARASRAQERIDLKDRQEAEKERRATEAARKEALRPKFLLPVKQRGLSAYFGQAGVNWMSIHTGIDFPVSYGTPVGAATDGTIRTQWNNAYGNMAILTAPDGTETWYCHLSSTRVRSGHVQAGDIIAYSGNTGNSTGPHLHFEVRPNGGSPINPLPWLLAHGLDPR